MVSAGSVTVIGYRAAENLPTCTFGTFLGRYAGAVSFDGSPNTAYGTNVTAIGNTSLLSGNNQVQLGNADTTVYFYQMAQRSDERDKTDIRDTKFGRELVRKLRFVDYRWDVRDSYLDYVESEVEETVIDVEKIDTGFLDSNGEPLYRVEQVSRVIKRTIETVTPR